jgi:exodeoxyribonuclease VII small subunit
MPRLPVATTIDPRTALCKSVPPDHPQDNITVTAQKKTTPNLEKSMAQLEEIVQQLEDGDIPLEKALQQFEKGVKLSRDCQKALDSAEQRVKVLVNNKLEDFLPDDPAD